MPAKKVRLTKNVSPNRYKLTIRPDLTTFTFAGEEIIHLYLKKPSQTIVLHSKDIEVLGGYFVDGKIRTNIQNISYNQKTETVQLRFTQKLVSGKGKLHLHFRGLIAEDLRGFYRSQYSHQGQTQHLATTQFEATNARRAFPCFDEPSHKAIFELTLVLPKELTAISNTIETATPQGVEHDPGYKVVKFSPTPKMSTYLLAYIIGEFESLEAKTKTGVRIRVFTTPGKIHQAKFALEVATKSLDFLNEYFAIPYPLPVLDLVAIPDFSAGAMENWGAVTFRESALLVDEEHTAFANKQHIAEVIAHELVHQWFGNLVTMEWWTHLWLNESFAAFMSYVVIDKLFPEWKFWTRFVMHDHANALQLDGLKNTHPIEVEVEHPSQISEIFDAISYDKGASVLRMLQNYIGHDNFRDGLRHYLKKYRYKNTSSKDLWDSFEKISKKPVRQFMKQWITKPGYPLVSVVEQKPGKVLVSQERFAFQLTTDKTKWPIPLQFELKKNEYSNLDLLKVKSKQFSLPIDSKFIKGNPEETGFHRTIYSPSLLAKLYEPIKNQELSVIDRFGIIRDLFAVVKSGRLPTSAYLEFLTAYQNEDSYIIWTEILSGMAEIHNLFSVEKNLQNRLEKFYLQILKTIVDKVGWSVDHNESQARSLLRSAVLYAYGNYGDTATVLHAEKIFINRKRKKINPDLRATVYALNSIDADLKQMRELEQMFISAELQEEQRRIGRALMLAKSQKLYLRNLNFTLSNNVRSQDAPLLIASALTNTKNRIIGWRWLQKNWQKLHHLYHEDHLLLWIIKPLGDFTDLKTLQEIKRFFSKNPVPSASRTVEQVLEKISLNSAWYKRDKNDISNCVNYLRGL